MTMLRIIRDTAALFDLEKALQGVREAQLRAAAGGRVMASSDLADLQARMIAGVTRVHFSLPARLACMPEAEARALSDQQDYESRQQKDAERCILDAHRRILGLPCVGAPGSDDPDRDPGPEVE